MIDFTQTTINFDNVVCRMIDNMPSHEFDSFVNIAPRSEQHRLISRYADIDLLNYEVDRVVSMFAELID